MRRALRTAHETGGSSTSFRTLRRDRSPPCEIRAEATRVPGSEGRAVGVALILHHFDPGQELLRNEIFLTGSQRVAGVGSWMEEAGGGLTWSENLYDLMGVDRAAVLSEELIESLIHPDDRERAIASRQRHFETGSSKSTRLRIVRPSDGDVRRVQVTSDAIRDADGNVTGHVGTALDVTERWEAEAERQRNERLLLQTQHLAGMGSWSWDLETGRMEWSDRLHRILGVDTDVEPDVELYVSLVHGDDRAAVAARGLPTGEARRSTPGHHRIVRPADGEVRHVVVEAEPVRDAGGEVTGFVGTVLDVTEMKRVENDLRRQERVLNAAQRVAGVGSWTYEPDTSRVEWSDELYRIAGIDRSVMPTVSAYWSLVHPEDRPRLRFLAEKALRSGQPLRHEYRLVRPDGDVRHVVTAAQSMLDADGMRAWVGTTLDVTEQHALEDQLLQAQKMEAIGRLAGGIAHDFNNLLTVIVGCTEQLKQRYVADELEHLSQAAERATALTRQLLAFSRRASTEPRVVDPSRVIEDASGFVRRIIGEDIDVHLDLAPEPWAIRTDAGQLHQVVLNLAVNARDAMPEGGQLTIRTENMELEEERRASPESPAEHVRISVTDTGAGMSDEVKARAFEPFFTTKEVGKGTGLGLSTVFGIVQQAGGTVDIHSGPGGTTLELSFPRADDPAFSPRAEPTATSPTVGEETVLIVEDDPAIAELVCTVLENAGHVVHVARRPAEALEIFAKFGDAVDLVLTDLVMPDMSGRVLVRRLRERRAGLKVLFMSGYEPTNGGSATAHAGDPLLAKPFSPSQLLSKMREVLDG